ncbi:hypothetical protein DFO52_10658 [Enterobacter sp. AG326]|uniref:hypothetical protein n=1 Tax=Enterobacter sp. AG326 TaxID=2183902 RepID=UPI0010F3B405|nr:hypothetical protein [Enterobacter sp. AG326]TDP16152.1 hypothetical protein DFO52_10658 [Enterobacter sp. AG326]
MKIAKLTRRCITTELLRGLMESLDIAVIDPARGQQSTCSFAVDGFCGLGMLGRCRLADLISREFQLPGQNVSESDLKGQRQVIAKVTGCRQHARNGMAGCVAVSNGFCTLRRKHTACGR